MELKEIQEYVKKQLSEKRYNHSVGVMERSEELAKMYGADVEIAKKIGIAHDVAKEISEEDKLKYVKDNNIEIDEVERENTPLLHAKIGKDIAIKKFGFSESMGQAIANHTTGNKNMDIYSKILFIADRTSKDRNFEDYQKDIDFLGGTNFPVLDADKSEQMKTLAEKIAAEGDSVGGVLESVILGMPAGVGEPWFGTLESELSYALFSIPAIKGVQFGDGFDMVDSFGSEFNDSLQIVQDNGKSKVITKTNHNGGINGGISNGMPILFRCAVKPTPSIYKTQDTIDMSKNENAKLNIQGRHDPAIIHRARIVVDSVASFVIYDALAGRFGTDFFGEKGNFWRKN